MLATVWIVCDDEMTHFAHLFGLFGSREPPQMKLDFNEFDRKRHHHTDNDVR